MPDFSKLLFLTDYDRTLTAPDSTIPAANLEAIDYFMAHGGRFTLCTGRSPALFRPLLAQVRVNAPVILSNGACCYDFSSQTALFSYEIDLDAPAMVRDLLQAFPGWLLEIQGERAHYGLREDLYLREFCRRSGCAFEVITPDQVPPRIQKMAIYNAVREPNVAHLFHATPQEMAQFEALTQYVLSRYGHAVSAVRPATRILDLQSREATKGRAAQRLAALLERPVLVAAGDSENDLSMLECADLAFVPADAAIRQHTFHTVAPCGEGSICDIVRRLSALY